LRAVRFPKGVRPLGLAQGGQTPLSVVEVHVRDVPLTRACPRGLQGAPWDREGPANGGGLSEPDLDFCAPSLCVHVTPAGARASQEGGLLPDRIARFVRALRPASKGSPGGRRPGDDGRDHSIRSVGVAWPRSRSRAMAWRSGQVQCSTALSLARARHEHSPRTVRLGVLTFRHPGYDSTSFGWGKCAMREWR
jgi:hypothetical protein